jgi:putative endonuclease
MAETNRSSLKTIGAAGEQYATEYLINRGFIIRERNATSRWGEIDIIVEKEHKIYFIEVKSRIHLKQGMPYEAVRIPKLAHLMRAIQHYILVNHLHKAKFQLDVISILLNKELELLDLKVYENVSVDRFY